jgi:hypothetical protein
MAPQGRNPIDPDLIDVKLTLGGEDSMRAMQALAQQMSVLTAHLSGVGSLIPEQQVQGARTVQGAFNPALGVHEGPSPYRSQVAAAPLPDGAGVAASNASELHRLTNMSLRQRLRYYRNQPSDPEDTRTPLGRLMDREQEVYAYREEEQVARRSGMAVRTDFAEPSSLHAGTQFDRDIVGVGGGGAPTGNVRSGVSAGGSMPGRPGWLRALQANPTQYERAQEGFVLPQFGELTVQDKLRMASDFFTRSAVRAHERDVASQQQQHYLQSMQEAMNLGFSREEFEANPEALGRGPFEFQDQGAGNNRGRTANLLRAAADQAAQAMTVMNEVRRVTAWGSGMQQQGIAAGFERGGQINIPGTEIGIQNPFAMFQSGSAFREAINQRVNVERLRMRGGINRGQAQEIVGSLAGLGWTGEEGQNIAFDTVAPLVQQGQNPGIVSGLLDRSIRNGNASLEEFRATMDNLGPSARAARMSLDEYQQSLGEFADMTKDLGGTNLQRMSLGRTLSGGLGVAPPVAGEVMQSGLTQGLAMMRYGVLPNELAMAGTTAVGGSVNAAVDMAMRAAGAFNQDVTDAQGHVIIKGSDRQRNQAAAFMGVSTEVFDRLLRGRQISPHLLRAQDALKQFDAGSRGLAAHHGGARIVTGDIHPGDIVATHEGAAGAKRYGDYWGVKATVGGHGQKIVTDGPGATAAIRETGAAWNKVEDQLRAIAPKSGTARTDFMKRIDKLAKEDPTHRSQDATKLMADEARKILNPEDTKNKVYVGFTPAAAKYFEQVERKDGGPKKDANAGGRPINETASSHRTDIETLELLRTLGTGTG